jgi:hypothetical protein
MAPPRRHITKDMLIACREKGWHLTLAAAHLEMHRSSVASACERFGVVLPMHQFSPQRISQKSKVWLDIADGETKPKIKLSASPAAVERTLRRLQREKRLQALG